MKTAIPFAMIGVVVLGFGCNVRGTYQAQDTHMNYMTEDSVILTETTVQEVGGYSVAGENYFLRERDDKSRAMSIGLSIWKEEWPEESTEHHVVFVGDEVLIGDSRYILVLVEKREDGVSDAFLLRVQ
jgi:DNA-directed RNA polymerase beta subunit